VVIGAAMAVALVALAVALWQSHSSQAPATNGTPTSSSAPAQPTGHATTPVHPAGTPTSSVKPSAAVAKLQQELGQLSYYQGPANGIMGPQTIQAIKYLQRDAHLPQTGQMNAATQAALANFLAHGNNQMSPLSGASARGNGRRPGPRFPAFAVSCRYTVVLSRKPVRRALAPASLSRGRKRRTRSEITGDPADATQPCRAGAATNSISRLSCQPLPSASRSAQRITPTSVKPAFR